MRQIDIFDILEPEGEHEYLSDLNFRTMKVEEIVALLGDRLGLKFTFNDLFNEYQVKAGKRTLCVHLSHYYADGDKAGALFISCGWHDKTSGAGVPCDSLSEAYEFLHNAKKGANL